MERRPRVSIRLNRYHHVYPDTLLSLLHPQALQVDRALGNQDELFLDEGLRDLLDQPLLRSSPANGSLLGAARRARKLETAH